MQPDETIPLNLPSDIKERTRTTKSGTQIRFTVEVKAEPILHHFSDKEIGREPAEVLASLLRENLRAYGLSRPVAPTTQKKRRYAAAEFDGGSRWAMKRYSGGRMGPRRPDPNSAAWGSDSGRLAESLYPTWNPSEGNYTINTAANRLNRATFGPRFEQFLSEFSIAINTPRAAEDARFKDAQARGVAQAIQDKRDLVAGKRAELTQEVARLLRIGG